MACLRSRLVANTVTKHLPFAYRFVNVVKGRAGIDDDRVYLDRVNVDDQYFSWIFNCGNFSIKVKEEKKEGKKGIQSDMKIF